MDKNASLVEALQALAAEMAKASNEAEADAGLKKLRQIWADFLGKENDKGAVNAARRNAEALITWMESRLEQLKLQLARRRRTQEGEVMEQLAKQREAEGPSLLPTELVDAVVRVTDSKDPEEATSTAPTVEVQQPAGASEEKKPRVKEKEKPQKKEAEAPSEAQKQPTPETPRLPAETRKQSTSETPKTAEEVQKQPMPEMPTSPVEVKNRSSSPVPKIRKEKPEFTQFERLAAHLAASVGQNSNFFEKLRKAAKRPGEAQKAPADDKAAQTHYRRIHDLGKRLVNLELHAKAIARAKEKQEPVSPLVKTAARELKRFLREFKTSKEESPEMAGEYERRFGGWAEQFSAMKPEKGQAILDQCRTERQARKPAAETEPERETDAPQLVLKRDDYWPQS